jgi:hypothetical protein
MVRVFAVNFDSRFTKQKVETAWLTVAEVWRLSTCAELPTGILVLSSVCKINGKTTGGEVTFLAKPSMEGLQPSQSHLLWLCPGVFAVCVLNSALEAKVILQSLHRVFDFAIPLRCYEAK